VWVAQSTYEILGTRVRVRSQEPSINRELDRLLARFEVEGDRPVRPSRTLSVTEPESDTHTRLWLYRDCRRIAGAGEPAVVVSQLLAEANRLAVEAYSSFAVHSGVVAKRERAVAFPAQTGGGKSTLTAACVLDGFSYVSDEALCVDLETAEVTPYPKPVSLSAASRDLLGLPPATAPWGKLSESIVNVEEFGGVSAVGSLTLSDVVIAEYGHSEQTLEPVPASEVMTTLLRMSFNSYKHPEASFRLTARLAGEVQGWRLRYGDPLRAAVLLGERLFR
jgi:hypothetical protein